MRWPFILALLLIAAPSWALANAGGTEPPVVIEGPARIIDGDTIDIAGERIRLHGIDAPESRQMCTADGVTWSCGQRATNALSEFIGRSLVTCEAQDTDRYGRTIAACYVRGEDIEAWMVRGGWALAYRRYSLDYVDEEAVAQDARAGLWRGEFVPPWDWAPQCAITGRHDA